MDSMKGEFPENALCYCKKRHSPGVRSSVFVGTTISSDDVVFRIKIGNKGRLAFRESHWPLSSSASKIPFLGPIESEI